jgi:hypothetical protein
MAVLMAVLIFQMCTYLCSNISIQNQKYKKNVSISFCKQLRTIFLHDKLLHMWLALGAPQILSKMITENLWESLHVNFLNINFL